MKKRIGYLLMALSVAATFGCNKDDSTAEPYAATCFYNRLVTQSNGTTTQELVTYGPSDRINNIEVQVTNDASAGTETTFDYDQLGRLYRIFVHNSQGQVVRRFELEYSVTGEMITKKEFVYYVPGGNYYTANHWSLEYNDAGKLVRRKRHEPYFTVHTDFVYNAAGNVVQELSYRGPFPGPAPALVGSREFEYDDRKPFYSRYYQMYTDALGLSRNNVTKITAKDAAGAVVPNESYTYAYTYTPDGYPATISSASLADPGPVITSQVAYNCR